MSVRNVPRISFIADPRVLGSIQATSIVTRGDTHWLNREPYERGWMVRARPRNWAADRVELVDAVAYRRHIVQLDARAICL